VSRLGVYLLAAAQVLFAAEHRGSVTSNGLPIPGATVTATQGGRKLVTTTDELGRYTLDLAPGAWTLSVSMFGFIPQKRELDASAVDAEIDWKLELNAPPRAVAQSRQAAFEPVNVNTVENEGEITNEAAALAGLEVNANDANDAFLVQGSLSGGLQNMQTSDAMWMMGRIGMMGMGGPGIPGGPGMPGAPGMPAGQLEGGGPGGPGGPGGAGRGGSPGLGGGPPGMAGGRGGFGGMGPGGRGGFGGGAPGGRGGAEQARDRQRPGAIDRNAAFFGNRRQRTQPLRVMLNYRLGSSALDAAPFSLSGQNTAKPSYAQNNFGITLGGPLHIPRLLTLSRANFNISYSGSRGRNSRDQIATVPTELERAGDFSQSFVRGVPVTIYDPVTHLPIADNKITSINPVAAALLQYFPLPNLPGTTQNYQFLASIPQSSDQLSYRLSLPLGRRNQLSFNGALQRRNSESAQLFGFRDSSTGLGQNWALAWNHIFSAGLINNARFTYNRNRNETVPYFANKQDVAAELGINGTSHDPINWGPPNLSFTNFGALTDASASLRRDQNATVADSVTIIHHTHTLTAGGDFRRTQLNSRTDQNARGSFTFSGLATSGFDANGQPIAGTGFDFADFLLGLPQSSSVRFGDPNTYFRESSYSAYVMDEWRARSNLSFNLGLRYEYFAPMTEKYGRMANLDIAPGFTGVAVVTPDGVGPYSGRFPAGLINPDKNNFSPRLGIAWRPIPARRLTLRAGYGVFYDGSVYTRFATRLASQPPFAHTASLSTSLAQPLTLTDGFPTGPSDRVTNTYAVDRGYRVGYAQTWNFAIQQELGRGFVVEGIYQGTKGTKLDMQRAPNRAAPGSPLTAEQRRLIGNAIGFTFDSSEGNSIYHAAQFRLTRRFRRGVSVNMLYTFSKSIDNASSIGGQGSSIAQNDKDLSAERGLSSFDRRHTLSVNYVLTSPADERGLLAGNRRLLTLLRNWTLTGGVQAQTGAPFTATVLGNMSDTGGTGVVGSGRADATGLPISGGTGEFFNLLAFTLPPAGRFGNAGRNTIPGPGSFTLNASFGRAFQLGGESRRSLDLRLDSTNTLNHVNYTSIATVINAANYGLATAAGGMRRMTVSVRFRF
jgi:hypothetical protein